MFAQAIADANIKVASATDIEIDSLSRKIASRHHDLDHDSLPQDLHEVHPHHILEQAAKGITYDMVIATTPCQGLSRANSAGKGLDDKRSGLFLRAIELIAAVKSTNPSARFIAENVDFRRTHPTDYARVCESLGEAEFRDAADSSGASRRRLYWHNLGPEPRGARPEARKPHVNSLLDEGATLTTGRETAPCLMASWACRHRDCWGAPDTCRDKVAHSSYHHMSTHNPVRVVQDAHERELRPAEAERIMGLAAGYTASADGAPVPDIERLQRLGGGIDLRSVGPLVERWKATLGHRKPTPESTTVTIGPAQSSVADHVQPHTGWNVANIARWLTQGELPTKEPGDSSWRGDWRMRGADDLIRCCPVGFPLRYEGDRTRDVESHNGKTCQMHPVVTATELEKEVAKGHIAGPYLRPPLRGFKVVPRGLKEEPTKFRPLSEANRPVGDAVNESIPRATDIQLTRAQDIEKKITATYARTGSVWMAKRDIKAAYRTMPVRPEDWQLQGIKWDGQYYIDKRMSFGCRSSVDQWLRFSDALAWALLRWGVHALHYVDDFIFIAGSEEECAEQVRKFDAICEEWGITCKVQEDCGPAQTLTALGVEYDLVHMKRKITPGRIEGLTAMLEEAGTSTERALWERLTGVLWYVIRCAPIGTPQLQPIMEATLRARRQKRPVAPSQTAREAVQWWKEFLLAQGRTSVDGMWHGESLIPTSLHTATTAMGDAGSEWGMGGHDDKSYFKAKWTEELWADVQREQSTSSLHMEALQLLVMTRVMAESWAGSQVMVELDSLGLTQTHAKGRHSHPAMNAILRELAMLQIGHSFTMHTRWVRRCWNEAADALSKDDMPRFWDNVRGDRTQIVLQEHHTRRPAGAKTGGMRRTKAEQSRWDNRPTHRAATVQDAPCKTSAGLRDEIAARVRDHQHHSHPLKGAVTGARHYLRFCKRTGREHDVAPAYDQMVENTIHWMADAVLTYTDHSTGKRKAALATGSVTTYLSHIDRWYAHTTGTPRGLLQKSEAVARHRKLIVAEYRSGQSQVHGITFELLKRLSTRSKKLPAKMQQTIRAAHTLAWFALLRPTEYMLTPAHARFDKTRHLRAGDITFWKGADRIDAGQRSAGIPDRMVVNVKQSKTDWARLGANLIVGATGGELCPVTNLWQYMRDQKPPREGPLFPGLKYTPMLKVTRALIGDDSELYGMHSFRVGGAQAMALAGRSAAYIMGRGRWKNIESVSRYVEATDETKAGDSAAMARTQQQRHDDTRRLGRGGIHHSQPEGDRLLPPPRRGQQSDRV